MAEITRENFALLTFEKSNALPCTVIRRILRWFGRNGNDTCENVTFCYQSKRTWNCNNVKSISETDWCEKSKSIKGIVL